MTSVCLDISRMTTVEDVFLTPSHQVTRVNVTHVAASPGDVSHLASVSVKPMSRAGTVTDVNLAPSTWTRVTVKDVCHVTAPVSLTSVVPQHFTGQH